MKDNIMIIIIVLILSISALEIERKQDGDIILDVKSEEICNRFKQTKWTGRKCRCKTNYTTFYSTSNDVFGCYTADEIKKCNIEISQFGLKKQVALLTEASLNLNERFSCKENVSAIILRRKNDDHMWKQTAVIFADYLDRDQIIKLSSNILHIKHLFGALMLVTFDGNGCNECILVKMMGTERITSLNYKDLFVTTPSNGLKSTTTTLTSTKTTTMITSSTTTTTTITTKPTSTTATFRAIFNTSTTTANKTIKPTKNTSATKSAKTPLSMATTTTKSETVVSLPVMIGVTAGEFLLFVIFALVILKRYHRTKNNSPQSNASINYDGENIYSYACAKDFKAFSSNNNNRKINKDKETQTDMPEHSHYTSLTVTPDLAEIYDTLYERPNVSDDSIYEVTEYVNM